MEVGRGPERLAKDIVTGLRERSAAERELFKKEAVDRKSTKFC